MRFSRLYDNLFYRLYRWSEYVYRGGAPGLYQYHAVIMISALCLFNLLTVVFLLQITFSWNSLMPRASSQHIVGVVLICVIMFFNYLYFIRGRRYPIIISRYKDENNKMRKRNSIFTFAYFFGSFVTFIGTAVL